jgi:menaquinone-dependent protoporphyrinogen oxidase
MPILVTYASKHGSTQDIAERIAGTLRRHGREAVVQPIHAGTDPSLFEAVIVGSAIYFGSWMKEATEFVRRHCDELAARPVWLFSSGPLGDTPAADPKELAEFQTTIHPRGHRTFVGSLDRRNLSFTERMIVKAVKAPEGDFRDWDDIDAWTEGIAQALASTVTPPVSTHDIPPTVSHPLQP